MTHGAQKTGATHAILKHFIPGKASKDIADAIAADTSLRIGRYTLKPYTDKTIWIGTDSGEGGEFKLSLLELWLDEFYSEHL